MLKIYTVETAMIPGFIYTVTGDDLTACEDRLAQEVGFESWLLFRAAQPDLAASMVWTELA